MVTREQRKILRRIYSKVPQVECKGLCHTNCTVIGLSRVEKELLTEITGEEPRCNPDLSCNYLDDNKRCRVYNQRPLICRAFGVFQGIECKHGCKPKDGIHSFEEMFYLQNEIDQTLHNGKHEGYWTGTEEQVVRDMAINSNQTVEQVRAQRVEEMKMLGITEEEYQKEKWEIYLTEMSQEQKDNLLFKRVDRQMEMVTTSLWCYRCNIKLHRNEWAERSYITQPRSKKVFLCQSCKEDVDGCGE